MALHHTGPPQKTPILQELARFQGILFDALLRPSDITMSQGWVLVVLGREDGLNQTEIAERMDIATVTTSKLINRMEARGYVQRRASDLDRRANRIYLTELGQDRINIMTQTIAQVDALACRDIADADLAQMQAVLDKIHSNLKRAIAEL